MMTEEEHLKMDKEEYLKKVVEMLRERHRFSWS
jgi:hypothetical protein